MTALSRQSSHTSLPSLLHLNFSTWQDYIRELVFGGEAQFIRSPRTGAAVVTLTGRGTRRKTTQEPTWKQPKHSLARWGGILVLNETELKVWTQIRNKSWSYFFRQSVFTLEQHTLLFDTFGHTSFFYFLCWLLLVLLPSTRAPPDRCWWGEGARTERWQRGSPGGCYAVHELLLCALKKARLMTANDRWCIVGLVGRWYFF